MYLHPLKFCFVKISSYFPCSINYLHPLKFYFFQYKRISCTAHSTQIKVISCTTHSNIKELKFHGIFWAKIWNWQKWNNKENSQGFVVLGFCLVFWSFRWIILKQSSIISHNLGSMCKLFGLYWLKIEDIQKLPAILGYFVFLLYERENFISFEILAICGFPPHQLKHIFVIFFDVFMKEKIQAGKWIVLKL